MCDIKISVKDFAQYIDRLNSGHDRDVVFYYLKDYLGIETIDLNKIVKDDDYEGQTEHRCPHCNSNCVTFLNDESLKCWDCDFLFNKEGKEL